jgi:hypothetical protein
MGIGLILVSVLIVLGYSTLGNPQSASAVMSLQSRAAFQPQTNLQHVANGRANLVWDAKQQTLTVKVVLSGLAPKSTHPAYIHRGSCETSDNGMLYTLNPVIADGGGKSLSTTTLQKVGKGIPASGWFIIVHEGPDLSTNLQMRAIACGDITNFNTSTSTNQTVNLALGPSQDINQAANGVATLSIANNQLTVKLTVSGLEPGSTHQAHIHQGSCRTQGPVIYPLTPVVVDKNGTGTSTTTIPKVTSIPANWYVNVHQSATAAGLSIQTGFDPLVCGDVDPLN